MTNAVRIRGLFPAVRGEFTKRATNDQRSLSTGLEVRPWGKTQDMTLAVVIGIVHFAVAFVLLASVRRAATQFPWLLALAAFFVVRGVDRLINAVHDPAPAVGQLADVCVVATLVLLLVGLPRTFAALQSAYDDARQQAEAYARALQDYRRLMRHRLGNPLAALHGGIQTLQELDLTPGERRRLLAMLHEQVLRLEQLSLDPQPAAPEERGLRPTPRSDAVRRGARRLAVGLRHRGLKIS